MALVVYPADGYDSFISREDADAYLASMGYSEWAALAPEVKEAALRRATQYVFARRLNTEALQDSDGTLRVHGNVAAATAEAAIRVNAGTLYRDINPEVGAVIEKTVGPITTRYAPGAKGEIRIPIIEDLLFGLVYTGPSGYGPVILERA